MQTETHTTQAPSTSLKGIEIGNVTKRGGRASATKSRSTATKGDLLGRYLAEVRRHPILDVETERALAIKYKETGDEQAASTLVTANLRLAVKIAFEYQRSWTNILDLIQEGNMGLSQALDRYDPHRGIRFTSYAQYWIRAFILQYLMNNVSLVRIGSTRAGRKLFYKLQKEKRALEAQGINPNTKILSERLEVSEQEIVRVGARLSGSDLSLDSPAPGDSGGRTLQEMLISGEDLTPEQDVAKEEALDHVRQAMEAFEESITDERELRIWRERLNSPDRKSLAQLGAGFGVSKERVRQLEERLKNRARTFLTNVLGKEIQNYYSVN